jgi:uncharacterized protein YndB with AHSA1/START domain
MLQSNFVEKIITIDAPLHTVWNVLTTSELVKKWITDDEGIEIVSDWKVGSTITFSGVSHRVRFNDKGQILESVPNKFLKYSYWSSISRLPDTPDNYSTIEFTLTTNENHTLVKVIQSNLVTEVIYKHINFYWNAALRNIKKVAEEIK